MERCRCFPDGAPPGFIHAAYNPPLNLVENVFAELDRGMFRKQKADALRGAKWPTKGAGKETFWKARLIETIAELNEDKQYFANLYDGYMKRCRAFRKSRGKRLKTSKY
jgi:hypothetical protein